MASEKKDLGRAYGCGGVEKVGAVGRQARPADKVVLAAVVCGTERKVSTSPDDKVMQMM